MRMATGWSRRPNERRRCGGIFLTMEQMTDSTVVDGSD